MATSPTASFRRTTRTGTTPIARRRSRPGSSRTRTRRKPIRNRRSSRPCASTSASRADRGLLDEVIGGETVRRRLARALEFVMAERLDASHGLVWGATTADWGDLQPEHAGAVELDATSHRAIDVYDNAMFVIAINDYLELVGAEHAGRGALDDRARRPRAERAEVSVGHGAAQVRRAPVSCRTRHFRRASTSATSTCTAGRRSRLKPASSAATRPPRRSSACARTSARRAPGPSA